MILPPPPLESLPYGSTLYAGMGTTTVVADLDVETFSLAGYVWDGESRKWHGPPGAPGSTKGLTVVGAANYAMHPSAEILVLSYDLKDGLGRRRWRAGQPCPADLAVHIRAGRLVEAWNVSFERWMWENVAVGRLGWPPVAPTQWRCAMAKARAHALPGALGKAGAVLQLRTLKDDDGGRLIRKFSMPRNPTAGDARTRINMLWTQADVDAEFAATGATKLSAALRKSLEADIADTTAYANYNETDIATEAEASSRIPDLDSEELAWWQVHEDINHRGVQVDTQTIAAGMRILQEALAQYNAELFALTGIDAASKVAQLLAWLRGRGVRLDSLDEEAVEGALKVTALDPQCRRVLEIRATIGSASVKKLFAMANRVAPNGRLNDLYVYHGARTGRSTGEGPQPTNLPKAGPPVCKCVCGHHHQPAAKACPWCGLLVPPGKKPESDWTPAAAQDAIDVIRTGSLATLQLVFGDALAAIAGALRGLYVAAPGHDLICSDYNSIEAIGLAMLAGEAWRIEVFQTHGKIYETSAAKITGIPFEEMMAMRGYDMSQPQWWNQKVSGPHHPSRQKLGKVSELASGYQGWIGAWKAFGADAFLSDEEMKNAILAWREASPAVVHFWGGQETGPRWNRTPLMFGVEGMAVSAVCDPGTEYPVMRLDGTRSGVTFVMRADVLYCRLPSGRYLTYHHPRLSPSERGGQAISYEGYNTNPKNGPVGWIRMNTWGGRLVENINQAACRDIMTFACRNLEAAGYPVVLHIYDEIVSEIPEGWGSQAEFEAIMERRPPWAHDWPIRAPGAWRAKRYRKG